MHDCSVGLRSWAVLQALNAAAGFLLVRTLEKPDYAWVTIAGCMGATLAILTDAGIVSAVTSIVGSMEPTATC